MAQSSADRVGTQPEDGWISWTPIKGTKLYKWKAARTFIHTIDNSPASKELWDKATTKFGDGFYAIPYNTRRAAFTPTSWAKLRQKFDAVGITSLGFNITQCKVQEQTAKRYGDSTTIQSVDPGVVQFETIVDKTGFLSRKEEMVSPKYAPNANMTTPRPKTFQDMKLSEVQWKMGAKWKNAVTALGIFDAIDGAKLPPFNIEHLIGSPRPTLAGWKETFELPTGLFATAPFDVDHLQGAELTYMNNQDYWLPKNVKNEKWPEASANFKAGQNKFIPERQWPACYVRLDRVHTLGGDILRNCQFQITYYAEGHGVAHDPKLFHYCFDAAFTKTGTTADDFWDTAQISRTWTPLNPEILSLWDIEFDILSRGAGAATEANDNANEQSNEQSNTNEQPPPAKKARVIDFDFGDEPENM